MNFISPLINKFFFSAKTRPEFLIIGAQKSGTTALFNLLNSTNGFCGARVKETGFFTKDDFYREGESWYSKQFKNCGQGMIKFEATPEYLYYVNAPGRIFSYNKSTKLVVILREPAARCYSAWNMFRRFNKDSSEKIYNEFTKYANPSVREAISNLLFADSFPSFKQAVLEDIDRYKSKSAEVEPSFVRRGIYCEQIENYLKYFRLSDFLFLEQRELSRPDIVLQKISIFLGKKNDMQVIKTPVISNAGIYENDESGMPEVISTLKEFYKPFNEKLFGQIGVRYDWNEG